ncbi:MAG: peroxide stress protein YaaA [Flavobacteriales bacterium]|jgi:cytoplasmic iron level regulating protein YaaA (DUF328/UPF0246 family)
MKIVVSPAKSLDFESKLPTKRVTQPLFLDQAAQLNKKLESKSKKAISDLMHISDKLADLNYLRYKDFRMPFTPQNARPAVFAFAGDVYTGLDAYSLEEPKIDLLNDTLRILSGMYGVLRPLDLMQPYRLEMGTTMSVNKAKNLYEFWGTTVTDTINAELKEGELFLNLASAEYFKVLQPKNIKGTVISPVFKDLKNGKLKIISFFAKKARGSMTRYVINTNAQTLDDIKGFDYDGYRFSQQETTKEHAPVFIR